MFHSKYLRYQYFSHYMEGSQSRHQFLRFYSDYFYTTDTNSSWKKKLFGAIYHNLDNGPQLSNVLHKYDQTDVKLKICITSHKKRKRKRGSSVHSILIQNNQMLYLVLITINILKFEQIWLQGNVQLTLFIPTLDTTT